MKEAVYICVPADMLTQEQTERLQTEVIGLLDPDTQEPVCSRALFDAPEDEPLRLWWHLSEAMLRLGKCSAVIFSPGWNGFGMVCSVVFEAAIRAGKNCFYTWRDVSGTLRLLEMGHCGGPEKREEDL